MMRLTFDPVVDAAAIDLKDKIGFGELARSSVCRGTMDGSTVSLCFDSAGLLLRIEILGATKILPAETLEGAERPGRREG